MLDSLPPQPRVRNLEIYQNAKLLTLQLGGGGWGRLIWSILLFYYTLFYLQILNRNRQ